MLKAFKNYREKISVRVNVPMSKIMRTTIKVGVRTYTTYVNCQTLPAAVVIFVSTLLQQK